jgi:predicted component of type VI protein secretion system
MITTGSEIVTNRRKVLLGEKTKPLSAKVIDKNRSIALTAYYDEQDGVVAGQAE